MAARHLSFTKAADDLHVTQGAVSHQVARLEASLQVKLFHRRVNGIILTEEGARYCEVIASAFNRIEEATDQIKQRGKNNVLAISTLASLASKWLMPRLLAFKTEHPEIEVRISVTTDLVDFKSDGIDAAIRYGLGTWSNLSAHRLMIDEIFPVCSPTLLASAALEHPSDLEGHTLLHTTGTTYDDWRLWLTAAGMPVSLTERKKMSFDLNLVMVQAAIDGLGVAIGRTSYVAEDIKAGRLVALFNTKLRADAGFYFVAPKQNLRKQTVEAFHLWLLAQLSRFNHRNGNFWRFQRQNPSRINGA